MRILITTLLLFGELLSSSGSNPYFWHITDFHLDPTYRTSQRSCNKDVPDPGRLGDYMCDAPYELIRASVEAMAKAGDRPQFIMYTGDSVYHPKSYDGFSASYVLGIQQNVTDLFEEFFPNVTFVPTLGNHDYYRKDQLPGSPNEIYNKTAQMWRHWFRYDDAVIETFNKGAYYTMMVDEVAKLRVVVPNTNLYLKANEATEGEADPGGQYQWMRNVLSSAREQQEKVFFVIHVPSGIMNTPGAPRWLRDEDNTKLNDVIREFADVISGCLSCHEHLDSFRLYFVDDLPVSVMYVAPSVTPWRARIGPGILATAHNPAVRKFTYDRATGDLTNMEQYFLDLPAANNQTGAANWQRLYTFTDLYGVDNMTPGQAHRVVQKMEANNSYFREFYRMNTVNIRPSSVSACDDACKRLHFCSIQNVDYSAFDSCNQPPDSTDNVTPKNKVAISEVSMGHVLGLTLLAMGMSVTQ